MANEIKLVTYANSEVTPQNDAVLTNLEIPSNGVIFGCNVTIKNASTLHINAGMGVVYGREFEIVDSDIPVSLSSSGTLLGQLYVHIDLANTSEPAQLLVDTGNSLTPLVDDPTINITTGSTDYQLATFTVDTSTLDNLVETFDTVQNASALVGNTDISGIADGTLTGGLSQLNSNLSLLSNHLDYLPSSDLLGYVVGGAGEQTIALSGGHHFSEYVYVYIALVKDNNHYSPTYIPIGLFSGHQTTIYFDEWGTNSVHGYITPIDDTHITARSDVSGFTIACWGVGKAW